jgi:hypothetical protein
MDEQSESKVTLPWAIAALLLTSPLLLVFMHFGKAGEGRAAWLCASAIFLAARMRWEMSRKNWFWPSIAGVLLIHIPLVFLFPWSADWFPSFMIFPFFLFDFFLSLVLIHGVEKLMRRRASCAE